MSRDGERRAKVALSLLANPGDPVLGAALRTMSASDVLGATSESEAGGQALLAGQPPDPALARAIRRWRARIPDLPGAGRHAAWQESGLRLIHPGDPEWPTQLDDLGDTRALLLWAHGGGRPEAELREFGVHRRRAGLDRIRQPRRDRSGCPPR